jgi:hypothetical protein
MTGEQLLEYLSTATPEQLKLPVYLDGATETLPAIVAKIQDGRIYIIYK